MKQKTRKMKIRYKLLIPVIIITLLTCMFLGMNSYIQISNGMVEMGVEQADTVSTIAVKAIDGDLLKDLEPGDEETENYQTILQSLRNIQKSCGIAFLYTLYTDGRNVYYGIDTDSSINQNAIGTLFEVSYEELKPVFEGETYVQDYIDKTEDGNLISSYHPIYDSQGNIVAIMGCDYDADNVVMRLNSNVSRMILMTFICLVIAIILLSIMINAITKSLNVVNQKIYELVNCEGDLTQKLDIRSGDEMELIADNINSLLEHIRGIMRNISAGSNQAEEASKTIAGSLVSAGASIEDVSATMEEMSAAMEETSASLNQINDSVFQVDTAVDRIAESAREGRASSGAVMQEAIQISSHAAQAQTAAKEQVQQMAASVNQKIEQSKAVEQISDLTTEIINITDQTNLLALNASIEAARAGEAGKGFAVVADEIGKLATNSAKAAGEIKRVSADVIHAVDELAQESEDLLVFMEEVALNGYEKLLETSEGYRSNVGEINSMMQDFAEQSQQLQASIDNIKDAIEAVNIAVEESTQGITNIAESSGTLATNVAEIGNQADANMNVAEDLNAEVNKFKLD